MGLVMSDFFFVCGCVWTAPCRPGLNQTVIGRGGGLVSHGVLDGAAQDGTVALSGFEYRCLSTRCFIFGFCDSWREYGVKQQLLFLFFITNRNSTNQLYDLRWEAPFTYI